MNSQTPQTRELQIALFAVLEDGTCRKAIMDECKVDATTLSCWATGHRRLGLDDFKKIARLLTRKARGGLVTRALGLLCHELGYEAPAPLVRDSAPTASLSRLCARIAAEMGDVHRVVADAEADERWTVEELLDARRELEQVAEGTRQALARVDADLAATRHALGMP